jgi:hypothetical protein
MKSLIVFLMFLSTASFGTTVKDFVSFKNVRCDANGEAFKVIENVDNERTCFKKCRDNSKCNVATFAANKDRCVLLEKCPKKYEVRSGFSVGGRVNYTNYFRADRVMCRGSQIDSYPTNTEFDCMKVCNRTPGCKAFSINEKRFPGCKLYSRCGTLREIRSSITYKKRDAT